MVYIEDVPEALELATVDELLYELKKRKGVGVITDNDRFRLGGQHGGGYALAEKGETVTHRKDLKAIMIIPKEYHDL